MDHITFSCTYVRPRMGSDARFSLIADSWRTSNLMHSLISCCPAVVAVIYYPVQSSTLSTQQSPPKPLRLQDQGRVCCSWPLSSADLLIRNALCMYSLRNPSLLSPHIFSQISSTTTSTHHRYRLADSVQGASRATRRRADSLGWTVTVAWRLGLGWQRPSSTSAASASASTTLDW